MPHADDFAALVQRYKTQDGVAAKSTLERLQEYPNAEKRLMDMVFGPDQRAALRALADLCRKKVVRETAAPMVVKAIDRLVSIPDDKARKTVYALVGQCAPDACADKLFYALKNEQTRFARPSIILALGNTREPAKYLEGYVVEPGEPKHVEAERDALKKALGKAAAPQKAGALRLPEWCVVTYIKRRALQAEAESQGVPCRTSTLADTMAIRSADLKLLRCWEDALYDIGTMNDYKAVAEVLDSLGCNGCRYRVEAGAVPSQQRREMIRAVSTGLSRFGYEDNPSAYAFEIRLLGGRMWAVFPGDDRFSYRKEALPASINPVTAASIMRLCRPYMKENARVLDPFCGSGTMLIERAKIKPAQSLVGVDISAAAIRAACANRKASGLAIALIHGDALQFGATRCDEVISNMPFGIRVSGHTRNERLYAAFADRLVRLLEDGGHAFLLTQEKKLLRDSLKEVSALRVIHEEVFESGGLSPSLYIIKKERAYE
jgi:tRNA G46 methylase TrmB